MKKIVLTCAAFLFGWVCRSAELVLAPPFTDHAVFQRDVPLPVWGHARPGAEVTVRFGRSESTIRCDAAGRWEVRLPAQTAGFEPRELTVRCEEEEIRCRDILVGEVWFASGQSNMDFRMRSGVKDMERELAGADWPSIRFFETPQKSRFAPSGNVAGGRWEVCTPESVGNCSAVAYFFARNIHLEEQVPVGVIVSALGATRIESWMSREALATIPRYREQIESDDMDQQGWDAFVERVDRLNEERWIIADTMSTGLRAGVHEPGFDDRSWKSTALPLRAENLGMSGYWGMLWVRRTVTLPEDFDTRQACRLCLPVDASGDRIYVNGKEVMHNLSYAADKTVPIEAGLLHPGDNVLSALLYITWGTGGIGKRQTPCYLETAGGDRFDLKEGAWRYNREIEPPVPPYEDYTNHLSVNFNGMVHPFIPYAIRGFIWYQGEANVSQEALYPTLQAAMVEDWRIRWRLGYLPFLYVQLANFQPRPDAPVRYDAWAAFRDAQTGALSGIPHSGMACTIDIGDAEDIHPRNKQDVAHRLYQIARAKVYAPESRTVCSGPMFDGLSVEGNRIRIRFRNASGLCGIGESPSLEGFAVEDRGGRLHRAGARIEEGEVVVELPEGVDPVRIQYAWSCNPPSPLYNAAGLPAVPFNVPTE